MRMDTGSANPCASVKKQDIGIKMNIGTALYTSFSLNRFLIPFAELARFTKTRMVQQICIVYIFPAACVRRLESESASPHREPLAGLVKFAAPFWGKHEIQGCRVPRRMLRSFELRLALNRPHSPPCPTSPELSKNAAFVGTPREVGQAGVSCDG